MTKWSDKFKKDIETDETKNLAKAWIWIVAACFGVYKAVDHAYKCGTYHGSRIVVDNSFPNKDIVDGSFIQDEADE